MTAPFSFAFAGSAIFVAVIRRELRHIAHADDAQVRLGEALPRGTSPD